MEKQGILIVSFGTTYPDTRKKTIEVIEQELAKQFPERSCYRAFTSDIVRKVIQKNEGIRILNVADALDQMKKDGITDVLVQPTHIIAGIENDKMLDEIEERKKWFQVVRVGRPLLDQQEDYIEIAKAVLEEVKKNAVITENTAVVYMGHGSEHAANESYPILQETFRNMGYKNIYVSTVEGSPNFIKTMEDIKRHSYETIILHPFMIVSGDHVRNDMASKQTDSWKSQLEQYGYKVICLLTGLGELKAVQKRFFTHAVQAAEV